MPASIVSLAKVGAVEIVLYLGRKWNFANIFYIFRPTRKEFGTGDVEKNWLWVPWKSA